MKFIDNNIFYDYYTNSSYHELEYYIHHIIKNKKTSSIKNILKKKDIKKEKLKNIYKYVYKYACKYNYIFLINKMKKYVIKYDLYEYGIFGCSIGNNFNILKNILYDKNFNIKNIKNDIHIEESIEIAFVNKNNDILHLLLSFFNYNSKINNLIYRTNNIELITNHLLNNIYDIDYDDIDYEQEHYEKFILLCKTGNVNIIEYYIKYVKKYINLNIDYKCGLEKSCLYDNLNLFKMLLKYETKLTLQTLQTCIQLLFLSLSKSSFKIYNYYIKYIIDTYPEFNYENYKVNNDSLKKYNNYMINLKIYNKYIFKKYSRYIII